MVRVQGAKSDCSRRSEAEVRILNSKTTWSEFHLLSRVSPKQLCALAHLGCTCKAGTSQLIFKSYFIIIINKINNFWLISLHVRIKFTHFNYSDFPCQFFLISCYAIKLKNVYIYILKNTVHGKLKPLSTRLLQGKRACFKNFEYILHEILD